MSEPERAAASDADGAIARRIGEWQTRLLQLNRRNNLLYFKPGRSAVGITEIAPDELDARLRRARRGLQFPHVNRRPTRRRGFAIEDGTQAHAEPEIRPGDLTTDCEPGDLQRRLGNLRRRDREWEEEQGLNVLFLAMGFLNWVDADGEAARSPLVLIPCDLERDSPRDPYRLRREDDDPIVNPTLRHQLSLLGLDLPEFSGESTDEDESIEEYVNRVSEVTQGRPGWSSDFGTVLGTFSYSKLAMYEDLTRMREQGVRSELTRLLAGGGAEHDVRSDGPASAAPRDRDLVGGRLDDLLDIRDQYAVLPADFSQLRAIEEARTGGSLVIHGPPGTGKSQTISNLIATLIADGKRALFVSEKTAALDVVKRRLEECGLGVFCLDLHSDRGKKREVYSQLRSSLADARQQTAEAVSVDELIASRDYLNKTVRLLHLRREPLGLSAYDVQGHFARLRDLPRFEGFEVPAVTELTTGWIRNADRQAHRIALRPDEFRSHSASRWLPLSTPQSSLQLPELIRDDMEAVLSAVASLRDAGGQHSGWLGVPAIGSAGDAHEVVRLLGLLANRPRVPAAWLTREAVERLRRLAREQWEQQRERRRLEDTLSAWFDGDLPIGDYRATANAIRLAPADQEAIEAIVGGGWGNDIGADPAMLSKSAEDLHDAVNSLHEKAGAIAEPLAEAALRTLGQIDQALDLTPRILRLERVPEQWLSEAVIDELESNSENARSLLGELVRGEELLGKDFSETLIELVDEEMLVRYRTDHQSFWRHLGGSYRQDQRTLRGQLLVPRKLSLGESLAAVELAVEVQRQRERWDELEPGLKATLGARFRGRETDWERVLADLADLRSLLSDWTGDPAALRDLTTVEAGGTRRHALESAYEPLQSARERYRLAAEALGHEPLENVALEVGATREAVRRVLTPLRRVSEGAAWLYGHFVNPPADFEELHGLVEDGVRLTAINEEDARMASRLSQDFGALFEREATDWSAVSEALDWTTEFLDAANGRVSDTLRQHVSGREPSGTYEERAASLSAAAADFARSLNVLDRRFTVESAEWSSWDSAPLDALEAWASDLRDHAGESASWNAYKEAVSEFEELLGAGAVSEIRELTDKSEDVPGIVRRGIYGRWLEEIYDAEPELRAFNRVDHEEIRDRFRRLDERFATAARQRVRERVFTSYPEQHATPLQSGQLGTLSGELSKRSRQKPVRRLIELIPNVLQALKPCFLMSPLAVSQYLPAGPLESDHLEFDVVIFDEASQVLPEDALPAMERARQVIVVGDRLQLPPTTFFQGGLDGDDEDQDEDEDESSDSFEGRESILDVMIGQVGNGIAERYLSVHYRSRCESLIRFSNHAFYEDRLLTFPGPNPASACVRDEYLPEATYDAGGSRTNRGEAERVTDIVFELMAERPPKESVGVVALSRPQADLIDRLIEERRLLNRHLDDRFSEDLDERFFVKNLENVQGDERDHMILSIGYGPTPSGAVPNRFGPINLDGGERRLNVAVTRARRSMTVVHSLRPEDIRSGSAGARQLRRYLEYARNPDQAIEGEVTGTGEPESPFEEAVLAALRSRGHRVDAQIGVSGYRIDLGIRSEDGEGFDLGIECDGAIYHSSPAARDRDWLRQQILEGLGWHIHRVWSTAWIRNPEAELDALEQALERARFAVPGPRPATQGDTADELDRGAPSAATATPTPVAAPAPGSTAPAQFFDEYRRFETGPRRGDLREVSLRALATLVHEIVAAEQPVHIATVIERLRTAYGLGRAGKRIREHIGQAVDRAVADASVRYDDGDAFLQLPGGESLERPRQAAGRPIGQIANAELDLGLMIVARRTFGSPRDDLVREAARQFGYRRTGRDIAGKLDERIDSLLGSGRLLQRRDMLVASGDNPDSAES